MIPLPISLNPTHSECKPSSHLIIYIKPDDAYISAWEETDSEIEPSPKKKKVDNFVEFYDSLISNVNEEEKKKSDVTACTLEDINYEDKQSLLKAVKSYTEIIAHHNRKGIEHYIKFGGILYKLKLLYITKCEDCMKVANSLDFLSCKRCAQLSNIKGFLADVKQVYTCEQNYINFIIRIYRLGTSIVSLNMYH